MTAMFFRGCQGNAIAEVIVALLALSPFLIGIPWLGKQLDIKHKSLDAARYAVWERTVWRSGGSNSKTPEDITLEAQDRSFGHPRAPIVATIRLRDAGVTENPLWRDHANTRLLDYRDDSRAIDVDQRNERDPVEVGHWFVPSFAYGGGAIATAASVLRVNDLGLTRESFASANASAAIRPMLQARARAGTSLLWPSANEAGEPPLTQTADGAILSDSWSARDETEFRRRVDELTMNEFVETIELPSRVLALNAIGPGEPLFGEGQFAWDPDLRPSSATLPRAYVEER
ncbi:MAG TPA: hypothetical protein VIL28_07715 [Steroidobacteraceae bacterium]